MEYAEKVLQISGQGRVQLRPPCTIRTLDGSIFKTKEPEKIHNLTNIPVFEILKHFPQTTRYKIIMMKQTKLFLKSIRKLKNQKNQCQL